MNTQLKYPLILCALMLSTAGCSKHITAVSSTPQVKESAQTSLQQEITAKDSVITILEEEELQPQDTIIQDVVAIEPQVEDSPEESFQFSEEQSVSIMLPEYRNMEINDISLLFTEMDDNEFHYPTDNFSYSRVTSPYGWRHRRMHTGLDLDLHTGDNIYAAFDGVVRIARYYGAYGNCVVIRHDNGLETLYAHSSKLLVDVNEQVKAGQVIALGGSTGRSSGSHLHFEVRVAGNYINPNLVIDTKNHSLQDKNLYLTRRNNRIFASNNDSAEEREADIIEELSIRYYTVKSGDVLSRIAINNRTTVATICRLNHISSRTTLRIGQRLIVRDGIRPSTSKSKQQTAIANTATKTTKSNAATSTYTVKQGDTLSAIAERNHTSVNSICSLNNITSRSTLHIGQKLSIHGTANYASSSVYIVKSGDTLSAIAERNHTSVSKLCQLNNITTRTTLHIGQKLKIA